MISTQQLKRGQVTEEEVRQTSEDIVVVQWWLAERLLWKRFSEAANHRMDALLYWATSPLHAAILTAL